MKDSVRFFVPFALGLFFFAGCSSDIECADVSVGRDRLPPTDG